MDSKIEPVAATDSFEIAATAAWDFIWPKLIPLNKEKGLAGVWSNGFRSGWDAKAREVEAALLAAEQRGREAERGEIVKALEPFVPDYQPWMDDFPNDEKSGLYRVGTFGQIRAARALLTELKETTDNG